MTIIKSEKRITAYHEIENLFTPDVFFNLMGWTDKEYHTERARYAISDYHYAMGEKLSFIFGTEKFGNITRAITSLGVLSLAKYYNIAEEQIEKTICTSDGKGYELLKKEIEYICSCKNIQTGKIKEKLIDIAKLYGNNKYSDILSFMLAYDNSKEIENRKTVNIDMTQFRFICEKELNDNMYKLKRNSENCCVTTYVSKIISHINAKMIRNHRRGDTKSEIYRGAHVTGLYIIAKWILNGILQKYDEYYSASLLFDIKDIIYSNAK